MEGAGQRVILAAAVSTTGDVGGSGKPVTCPTCGDRFMRPHALQQHQRIHAGQRDLPEMSFTRTAALGSFQLCNNGERFSVCDVCGKGFTVAALLSRHQAAHTGEEPLLCAHCGQTFALIDNYQKHCLTHCQGRVHCCNICHIRFDSGQQLELHRRRHALQFSFVCRMCGQGFSRGHYLDRHARLHEAELPSPSLVASVPPPRVPGPTETASNSRAPSSASSSFICHLCGDSFAQWSSLQQHRCT